MELLHKLRRFILMLKPPLTSLICALTCASLVAGCASVPRWSLDEPQVTSDDMRALTSEPKERDPSLYWDAVHQSSFYLIENSLDLSRQYRKLTGRMHEAVNADVFGNVPNTSWFTNRHGQTRMSRSDIERGPDQIAGPDVSGPWVITRAKPQGVTPGFFFKDVNGESFVLKFDPAMHPELSTGAEMVSTKLFHAIGYNVPENYLVTFDPSILTIKEGLEYKDASGHRKPFTKEVLEQILTRVALRPDGKIRAVASRLLPGKPVGPFSYKGRRKDDPNDLIPHEHRRELRGIKIFAQLVNNFDTKDHNTLDVLVNESGRTFIRHYLIDFSSTLGADSDEPKAVYKGYSYTLDVEQALVSLFTLGLRRWSWEKGDPTGMPASAGYFEAELFDPPGWKPLHGNPAFDNMTYADAAWACKILASFTKDDLLACVESGQYTDTATTRYLVDILWARRAKILGYYSTKVSLLDNFAVRDNGSVVSLTFEAVAATEPATSASSRFIVGVEHDDRALIQNSSTQFPEVRVSEVDRARMISAIEDATSDLQRVFEFEIAPQLDGRTGPAVIAHVYFDGEPSHTRLVGIEYDN